MSTIHLNQIRNKLEADYCPVIDMSDWAGKPKLQNDRARLSRALAAFALAERLNLTPTAAAATVTDGFDDNGLDAIGIDRENSTVVVVQAKWDATGAKAPQLGDVQKFVQGFRDLTEGRFDRFNDKVKAMTTDLQAAIDDTDVRLEMVLVHTGTAELSEHASRVLADVQASINDVSDIASLSVLGQAQVHSLVRRGIAGQAPNITTTLFDWGTTDEPYKAVYGQIDAAEIAEWWAAHRATLFDQNLRKFKDESAVNSSMIQTLEEYPSHFWYFNNGITVLCDRISQAPAGGVSRKSGKFAFDRARVVNGAQTVGSIGSAASRDTGGVQDARVHVRFISLEDCPEGFATEVTRATNTQNRVLARDFVSLDAEQERLREDLRLAEGKIYTIKTGESDPAREDGYTVVDATNALACAMSIDYAVLAKREVSRLWEDVGKPPYKDLFNEDLSATRMWRSVVVLRLVEDTLREEQRGLEGRDRLVAVHGNRLIAHLVLGRLAAAMNDAAPDMSEVEASVPNLTRRAFKRVRKVVAAEYPSSYPASIFKNLTKCRDIVTRSRPAA
jgi:hypothetical protein